jgi:hypothetical protein
MFTARSEHSRFSKPAPKLHSSTSSSERMAKPTKPTAWLARCGFSAALVLAACGFATKGLGQRPQAPATTTRDGTINTLNRYVDNAVPDIVLAGSSMTYRLKEEYFGTPRLRNLALAGGSAITTLEIVAGQRQLPKLVIVETNILTRAADTAVVECYSTKRARDPLFFRPIRTAIAAYENWMHAPVTHAQVEGWMRELVAQPPSEFDNRTYIERALQQLNAEDPTRDAKVNIATIAGLVDKLERRGTRVLLMEMPWAPSIEQSLYVRVARNLIHNAFPDPRRWLAINVERAELRWDDGVHLDERSAVLVSRYLDQSFGPALAGLQVTSGDL